MYESNLRKALSACAALGVVAAVAGVSAAPEPNYGIRLRAAYHVQITVAAVEFPAAYPGSCVISGEVVRVFRSRDGALEEGDLVEVDAPCDAGLDGDIMELHADPDELLAADFVEAFVDPTTSEQLTMSGAQYMVIKGPTDSPLCETERAGIMC